MIKTKLVAIFESVIFKRLMLGIGIAFMFLTAFIAVDPSPFLRLGPMGVFFFNLFGGPGLVLVPVLAKTMNPLIIGLASSAGMAFNDSVSWLIGSYGHRRHKHSPRIQQIEKTISKYGVFALFFWSLIPFPYDLIGLISGYLGLSYRKFLIPTFLGKLIRFTLLGYGVHFLFY